MSQKTKAPQSIWDGKRVLISCNSYYGSIDQMHADSFATFMFEMAPLIAREQAGIINTNGYMVDLERSKIARHAVEQGFTHLFLYDADMTVSRADIEALLRRNVDIVSGTYFMRGIHKDVQEFPCVASIGRNHITRDAIAEARDKGELIKADAVGAGSLLVTTSALSRIGYPAFRFDWRINGDSISMKGEDTSFCQYASECGIDVWMDPCVIPEHFSRIRIGFDVSDKNGVKFHTPNY